MAGEEVSLTHSSTFNGNKIELTDDTKANYVEITWYLDTVSDASQVKTTGSEAKPVTGVEFDTKTYAASGHTLIAVATPNDGTKYINTARRVSR